MWHRTILKDVCVTDQWISFLLQPVLPISGFIIMSLQVQGSHQFFPQPISPLSLGLLPMGHTVAISVAVCKATEGKERLMPCLWEGLRSRQDRNTAVGERQIAPSSTCIGNSITKYSCLFLVSIKIPRSLGMLLFTIHSPEQDYGDKTLCSPANYLTRTDFPQHVCWHWGNFQEFQEFEERLSCKTFLEVSYGNSSNKELHQQPWRQVLTGPERKPRNFSKSRKP